MDMILIASLYSCVKGSMREGDVRYERCRWVADSDHPSNAMEKE
jgi:hypothetical protein